MKKIVSCVLAVVVLLSCLTMFASAATVEDESIYKGLEGTSLNVYNWGEYISKDDYDVIKEFEELTGIKVRYTMYDSNENMYNKLKGGGVSYDVIIPSDYMIERLIKEDMLEKLDFSNIPNYKFISDDYKNLFFDPENQYSVPYNVGTVVLIYNKKVVTEKPTSWKILWDEKYKDQILMFDNPRDSFAIAQAVLGQDFNTTDKADWEAAANKLMEQKPLVQSYVMDQVFSKMESGEAALAPYYAGDYETMVANNPDLDFCIPEEGVNIFVDGMCIPKGSKNKKAAELFINFMLEKEVALANAEAIGYASPNVTVKENSDYSLKDSEAVYPDFTQIKTQYFHNLPEETLTLMTNLWGDVKNKGSISIYLYIGFGVVGAAVISFFVVKAVKKKKTSDKYDV
ncbi:MAG: spermidine/putrescine ABC transporter substrate-binding protein [Clostridiales bacterium]|nr:spermidine/putrescine ABC transporter substrate-binding protein [Clostridiales bacterium]